MVTVLKRDKAEVPVCARAWGHWGKSQVKIWAPPGLTGKLMSSWFSYHLIPIPCKRLSLTLLHKDILWFFLQWAFIYTKSPSTPSFAKKERDRKKKMMNWNFWSILITWISLCGCPSASHAALNSLVQSYVIFLFSYHRIFSLFMPVFGLPTLGKSTFLTHSHELHSLQSPVKKGVGCCVFVFFFHEILPRLWAATRGLKKPKKQEYYTSLW